MTLYKKFNKEIQVTKAKYFAYKTFLVLSIYHMHNNSFYTLSVFYKSFKGC